MTTLGERQGQAWNRSTWRLALERRAGGLALDAYLVAQANARGFHGAYDARDPVPVDPEVSLEDIVVGLSIPTARLDGRLFKLILRILQSGRLDPARLARRARLERADHLLAWLLDILPASERTPAVEEVAAALARPRGHRPLRYDYDPARLVHRPAQPGDPSWRTRRR